MRLLVCSLAVAATLPLLAQTPSVTHRCTQASIAVSESEGFLEIEMERRGDTTRPSVGTFIVYGSWHWFLPHGRHSIEFPAGAKRRRLRLPIDNDVYTGTQTTTVACGGTIDGIALPLQSEVALTVTDDERPPSLIVPAVFTASESDGAVLIPVGLDYRFGRGGFVRVEASDLTTSPDDYEVVPHLLFDPDEITDSIPLTIANDNVDEEDEELLLTLSGDVPARQIRVRIIDDDNLPFTLAFDRPSYELAEATPLRLTITRAGDLSAFTAYLNTLQHAFPFLPPFRREIAFAAGETTKVVELSFADGLYSGLRTGVLELVVNDIRAAIAALTVHDDEPRPVLSINPVARAEGYAPGLTRFQATLSLTTPLARELIVPVSTSDGTATARTDYLPSASTATILSGRFSTTYDVMVLGDDAVEPDETFTLTIGECCGELVTLGTRSATVTILNDDDGRPITRYSFAPVPEEWQESEKWLTATVLRSNNIEEASIAIVKLTSGGFDAKSFEPVEVRFAAGESSQTVRFYIDDLFYSPDGRATLSVEGNRGVDDRRNVRITEDEPKSVVTIEDLTVTEGAATHTAMVRISVEPPFEDQIVLPVIVGEDAAGDAGVPIHVTIPPFANGALPVTIVGDRIAEPVETFRVRIATQDTSFVIGDAEAVVTIVDDDADGARMTLASAAIARGTTTTVTITFDAPAPIADTIQLSTSTPEVLTIPPTVAIAAGSRTATFEVTGIRSGVGTIKATLPQWLHRGDLDATLLVRALSLPVVPDVVRVPAGGTATVEVLLAPHADHEVRLALDSLNRKFVLTDESVVILDGARGTFQVRGSAPGSGTIAITLPPELGGTVVNLRVEVTPP
jgi:Calx-beta domain